MTHWFDDFDHGILSPSGRVSARTRKATEAKLRQNVTNALRGTDRSPLQPTRWESLRRQATELRVLASRGMCVRKYPKMATAMEAEADRLEDAAA